MTTSFADYCATSDARDQIAANVLEWTQMLCLSLEQNFVNESIRRAHFFSASGDNTESVSYTHLTLPTSRSV